MKHDVDGKTARCRKCGYFIIHGEGEIPCLPNSCEKCEILKKQVEGLQWFIDDVFKKRIAELENELGRRILESAERYCEMLYNNSDSVFYECYFNGGRHALTGLIEKHFGEGKK